MFFKILLLWLFLCCSFCVKVVEVDAVRFVVDEGALVGWKWCFEFCVCVVCV